MSPLRVGAPVTGIRDERDPQWVAYLATRQAQRRATSRRRRAEAAARSWTDAQAELDTLHARAAIPDLVAQRDAHIGDWRAVLDARIHRDTLTGAWTTTPARRERRWSA